MFRSIRSGHQNMANVEHDTEAWTFFRSWLMPFEGNRRLGGIQPFIAYFWAHVFESESTGGESRTCLTSSDVSPARFPRSASWNTILNRLRSVIGTKRGPEYL